MRIFTFLLFVSILTGCINQSKKDETLLIERISRIENGLQPKLQIQGKSIPYYNIEDRMKALGVPGLSIAIINEGRLEWAKAYGIADSSENRSVTTETLFLAGSISKPVAAIRAHQLSEAGIINLDTDVNQYLKSWQLPENEYTADQKVTTRRILNHTAGLTVWGFPGYSKSDTIPSLPEVLDGKGNTEPVRVFQEPGKSWTYSGGGYTIMQLMITDVEGKSFSELMQSQVLDPLEMTNSTFSNPLPQPLHSKAATGYRFNGKEVDGKWRIYPEMAAAGLWTTPSQLVRYAKEIQDIYKNQQDGLLKANTVNAMLTPGLNDHGLGPVLTEHTFGHEGADQGFRATLVAWKEYPVAVVIMVNSENENIFQELKLSIAQEYGLSGIEPIKRAVHELSATALQRFTGKYNIPDLGDVDIIVKDNGLAHVAAFVPEPIHLLPASDSTFFNTNNGAYLEFIQDGNTITGFKFYGFEAKKIE